MNLPALIETVAARHDLPASLVAAIVRVESGGNPWAMRYEPAFFDRYGVGKGVTAYPPCSQVTEERLRAFSFGLMQLMGQTARELGYKGIFLTELLDPEINVVWGCEYLARQVNRYSGDLDAATAAYNAGSARRLPTGQFANQAYVDKVRKAGGLA